MNDEKVTNATTIVKTNEDSKNGQEKCPKCGATDLSINIKTGKLRCNFCRFEFKGEEVSGFSKDISSLEGDVIGSGASDIESNCDEMITLKCSSCGADVVIDASNTSQARCHWCRNYLSINEKISNGSIPDVVLPFNISKEEAQSEIAGFVNKRKFFANPVFKKEFTTENIMGVYFPYMLIDINSSARFSGKAEKEVRSYYIGSDDDRRHVYDADLYSVDRTFDLTIKGLSVESSSDKLNKLDTSKTTNIINAIMPFDTENCVKWNANYLRGFTSEKRDVNVEELRDYVSMQAKDIARYACNDTIKEYDRGANWSTEHLDIKGQQWKAAYLPVWLYSYQEIKGNKKLLHYVAVNARSKKTMGSVPIYIPKLIGMSVLVESGGILAYITIDWDLNGLFLLVGIIFYFVIYFKYRNSNARYTYEEETKTNITNLVKKDDFITTEKQLSSSQIDGANNRKVSGTNIASSIINSVLNNK